MIMCMCYLNLQACVILREPTARANSSSPIDKVLEVTVASIW